jgi:hypothetical protein
VYVAGQRWRRVYVDGTAVAITVLGLAIACGGVLLVLEAQRVATIGIRVAGIVYIVVGALFVGSGVGIVVRLNLARITYLGVHGLCVFWSIFVLSQVLGLRPQLQAPDYALAIANDRATISFVATEGGITDAQRRQTLREMRANLRADERRASEPQAPVEVLSQLTTRQQIEIAVGISVSIGAIAFFLLPGVAKRFY